jgi:GTP-binding protein
VRIAAEFVISAASPRDFPPDARAAIALVGRSNVGKSSLINALTRQRLARTSAEPGKTRLANVYRVTRNGGTPLYLVDLPGYGYARRQAAAAQPGRGDDRTAFGALASAAVRYASAAILLVDARHPGLANDREAWAWVGQQAGSSAVVATKIDKLARGERIRALAQLESVFEGPVLPVSAETGEGLDELWKLIDRLANSSRPDAAAPRPRPPRKR